eukprot:Gb_39364 [translate_table: standard]
MIFQGCEGTEVWSRSNDFIINRMTHEGAKWAARITARRLICSEANTYISHQWAAITLKVAVGITYTWEPWFLAKKKEEKDRESFRYLGNFYTALRHLNDGPDRGNRLPEYVKKQLKEGQSKTIKDQVRAEETREQSREALLETTSAGTNGEQYTCQQAEGAREDENQQVRIYHFLTGAKVFPRQSKHKNCLKTWSLLLPSRRLEKKEKGEGESTRALEVPGDIKPYVDLLRQKARVLKETLPPSSAKEVKFSKLKTNYAMLQLRCGILEGQLQGKEEILESLQEEIEQKDQEIANNSVLEIKEQIQKEIKGLPSSIYASQTIPANNNAYAIDQQEGSIGRRVPRNGQGRRPHPEAEQRGENIPESPQREAPSPGPILVEKASTSTPLESAEQFLESVGPLIDHIETRAASTPKRELIEAITSEPIPLVQNELSVSGAERIG